MLAADADVVGEREVAAGLDPQRPPDLLDRRLVEGGPERVDERALARRLGAEEDDPPDEVGADDGVEPVQVGGEVGADLGPETGTRRRSGSTATWTAPSASARASP